MSFEDLSWLINVNELLINVQKFSFIHTYAEKGDLWPCVNYSACHLLPDPGVKAAIFPSPLKLLSDLHNTNNGWLTPI